MIPRLPLFVLLAAAGLGVVVVLRRPTEDHGPRWETVAVRRADAVERLHETGALQPRDPLIVAAPFDGKIQFIVEDNTWVAPGDILLVIGDEDELKRINELRTQLTDARQELELAGLRLALARQQEGLKVEKAARERAIEEARHRILTTPAKGGQELVRLSTELAPLEAETARVRLALEAVRARWQEVQDRFLAQLDAVQANQDGIARIETRIDELETAVPATTKPVSATAAAVVVGKIPVVAPGSASPAASADGAAELTQARAERDRLRSDGDRLDQELALARTAREGLRGELDAAEKALATAEAAERELRIAFEVERNALPATKLAIDLRLAQAERNEAVRKLEEGQTAFEVQALPKSSLDDLVAERDAAEAKVRLTTARLAQASLPPSPEQLAEADARLAKAVQAAESAGAARDRALALAAQEETVQRARIARLEALVGTAARRFPSTIEAEITARLRERDRNPNRAAELDATIATLRTDLEQAKTSPANILTAPSTGLVRVRKEGNRQKLPGDQIWQADPACEVFPPGNMEVVARINEANVARLRPGMRVAATIPALGNLARTGTVDRIAGVGRDKHQGSGRPDAGVVQFDARIRLDPGSDGRDPDLRQGMSALVEIELQRQAGALVLPRGAVVRTAQGLAVRRTADGPLQPIQGEVVGDDVVVITGGLVEGDEVVIERR